MGIRFKKFVFVSFYQIIVSECHCKILYLCYLFFKGFLIFRLKKSFNLPPLSILLTFCRTSCSLIGARLASMTTESANVTVGFSFFLLFRALIIFSLPFLAELWRAKRACGAPWISKSTHPRKFGNHVTVHRPSAYPLPVRPHHRHTNVYSHTF